MSFLIGCGAHLGESAPPNNAYGFSGAECLSTTTPMIKDYLKGKGKTKELRALWDCVDTAVFQFKKNVRGNEADRYTSQELATFLEKNFFDKKKNVIIAPGLQAEFMKIKQLLVGGSREYITRKELDDSVNVFALLRDLSIDLNPYMKVVTMNWTVDPDQQSHADMDYFEESNLAIQKAAKGLAAIFQRNGQTYALNDFASLIEEIDKFFGEEWEINKTISKYLPVAKKMKKALAGGDGNIVAPQEWSRFGVLGSRGYVQYLRFYYFIKSTDEEGVSYRLAYISRTVEDLLSVFEDLTAGKSEGVVSRAEVFELLSTLSANWAEFKVSEELLDEVMKMKTLLFGGDQDSFTANDFNTARLKVTRLKSLVERFMPYWSIYCKEWDPGIYSADEAQEFFMESQYTLEATAHELGSLIEGSYDMRDLVQLAKEFERLYPPRNPDGSVFKLLEKYINFAIDLKWVSLGGASSTLNKSHWVNLFSLGSRLYTDYLYFHYFVEPKNLTQSEKLAHVSFASNQALNILSDVLKLKNGFKISSDELAIIAYDLIKLKLLPEGIDQQSANKIIKVFVNNIILSPEDRIGGLEPNGLTVDSVEVFRREFQVWLDTERFIAKISQKWGPGEGMSAKTILAIIRNETTALGHSVFLDEGLKELILSISSQVPITFDSQGRLVITNQFEQFYNSESLKQLNLSRAMSRLAIRSFAKDLTRINKYIGLSLSEVQDNFVNLKSVFVGLGWLEERDNAFGESRFRDSNLFTPHGNGDQFASYPELTDLIGMIVSGLNINSSLKVDLSADCLGNVKDPKDETLVKLDCAIQSYKKAFSTQMQATPEFLKFLKTAKTNDELDAFMMNVFKASGYVFNSQKMVRWGDLSMAPHVVQYIEMLMARFDKNKDGAITTAEALRAYSLFKGLLLEFAKEDIENGSLNEKDLPAIFCFMLVYGKPPETSKEKVVFYFKWKGKTPEELDVWADRSSLAKVLGYVADKTAKVAIAEILNFKYNHHSE